MCSSRCDRRVFERDLALGNIRAIIDIPSDFSRLTNRVEGFAPIQVITDGSEPNTANLVGGYVQGAFQTWLNQQSLDRGASFKPLVDIQPRVWFNEELESRNFLVPGSMATIMAVIGTLLTALVIAREWERGTMEALMATPVTISELLIGKFVPYFGTGNGFNGGVCLHCCRRVRRAVQGFILGPGARYSGISLGRARHGPSYFNCGEDAVCRVSSCFDRFFSSCFHFVRICIRHRKHAVADPNANRTPFRRGISCLVCKRSSWRATLGRLFGLMFSLCSASAWPISPSLGSRA